MCDRYVSPDTAGIRELWNNAQLSGPPRLVARYNVLPGQQIPMVIREADGGVSITMARWSLIPPNWPSGKKLPENTFKIKSELLGGRGNTRLTRYTRCIIPALGWYEWQGERHRTSAGYLTNQPHFHRCSSARVVAMAGLWSVWEREGDELPTISCAVLTRSAAPAIMHVHNRMPVILDPRYFAEWLDPATPFEVMKALLVGTRHDIECHPVGTAVNISWNDYPELIDPRVADVPGYNPT